MKTALSAVLLLSWMSLTGCSVADPKPGEDGYRGGTLTSMEAAPFEHVVRATYQAMKELQLNPMDSESDAFSAHIVGESTFGAIQQSHSVHAWLRRRTETTTRVDLRIMGRRDESRLRAILSEIRKRLGASKPAPSPAPSPAPKP